MMAPASLLENQVLVLRGFRFCSIGRCKGLTLVETVALPFAH